MNKILNDLKIKYQLSNLKEDELQSKMKDSGFYFNFILNISEVVINEPEYLVCFYNKLDIIKNEILNNKIEDINKKTFYMCYKEKRVLDFIDSVLKCDLCYIKNTRKRYAIKYIFNAYSIQKKEKYRDIAKRNYFLYNYFVRVLNNEKGFSLDVLMKSKHFASTVNWLLIEYPESFNAYELDAMKKIIQSAKPKFCNLKENVRYQISKRVALKKLDELNIKKTSKKDFDIVKKK